ncbi:MAG: hypothetical protein JO261_13640, partial [Alphaproteobacteria bacterium]|nr:hypothetical protein [Alphaproteobacteria bacterium]
MSSIEQKASPADAADPLAAIDATPLAAHPHPTHQTKSFRYQAALTLGALGVVFGD